MQHLFFISENILLQYPTINEHYKWIKIHTDALTFEDFSKKVLKR